MTEDKCAHTPGPHKVDGRNVKTQVGNFHLVWGGGDLLAYVAYKPDADLYASAPEMLEALEVLADFHSDSDEPQVVAARAAIAKARGES